MRISDWSSDVCSSDLPAPSASPAGACRVRRSGPSTRLPGSSLWSSPLPSFGRRSCRDRALEGALLPPLTGAGLPLNVRRREARPLGEGEMQGRKIPTSLGDVPAVIACTMDFDRMILLKSFGAAVLLSATLLAVPASAQRSEEHPSELQS